MKRFQDVTEMWTQLIGLMDDRKKRLTDAVDFHQFFTDADNVDNWMLDILKLVSSDDIGKDQSNMQTLLKKHKEVTDEPRNYNSTIDSLHEPAAMLGEEDRESTPVVERLASINRHYKD
jgi:spectrin beta